MQLWLRSKTTGECKYQLQPEQIPPGWKLDAATGDWTREVQSLSELVTVLQPLCDAGAVLIDVLGERQNRSNASLVISVVY